MRNVLCKTLISAVVTLKFPHDPIQSKTFVSISRVEKISSKFCSNLVFLDNRFRGSCLAMGRFRLLVVVLNKVNIVLSVSRNCAEVFNERLFAVCLERKYVLIFVETRAHFNVKR